MKTVMIVGCTGQDGSLLARHLLRSGDCKVIGVHRRTSTGNLERVADLLNYQNFELEHGDLLDAVSIHKLLLKHKPDEVYNEADQDNVGWSYDTPGYSYAVTAKAVGDLLEVIKSVSKDIRVFQPVSATMFGDASDPQSETTPFSPQSPYACAKVFAYHLCNYYRDVEGMYVSTAILYNHESTLRHEGYLLHKIAASAARIKVGQQKTLVIGDPSQWVDIGCAKEFVTFFPRILNLKNADDFVVCTPFPHQISTLVGQAFSYFNIPRCCLETDLEFNYPGKLQTLVGNPTKLVGALDDQPKRSASEVMKELLEHYAREYMV